MLSQHEIQIFTSFIHHQGAKTAITDALIATRQADFIIHPLVKATQELVKTDTHHTPSLLLQSFFQAMLKQLRHQKYITVEDMQNILGVSKSNIKDIEGAKKKGVKQYSYASDRVISAYTQGTPALRKKMEALALSTKNRRRRQ